MFVSDSLAILDLAIKIHAKFIQANKVSLVRERKEQLLQLSIARSERIIGLNSYKLHMIPLNELPVLLHGHHRESKIQQVHVYISIFQNNCSTDT